MKRRREAEPFMRRSLALTEAFYGRDHPEVAFRLNNLAMLLNSTLWRVESEPLMIRAVAILERSNGKHHPETTSASLNLTQIRAVSFAWMAAIDYPLLRHWCTHSPVWQLAAGAIICALIQLKLRFLIIVQHTLICYILLQCLFTQLPEWKLVLSAITAAVFEFTLVSLMHAANAIRYSYGSLSKWVSSLSA
jgi:hypothetical protein